MSVTISAWMLPAAFTVISAFAFAWWCSQEDAAGMYSWAVRPIIALPGWIIASLSAWLIWAVLT